MSGPKVLHVVPREVILQRCEAALAKLDFAIASWRRALERNELASDAALSEITARRRRLDHWMRQERFDDVERHAALEVEGLSDDLERRLAEKYSAEAESKRAERGVRQTARVLLAQAETRGRSFPENVKAMLEAGRDGKPVAVTELSSAVNQAFLYLADAQSQQERSAEQEHMLQALGAGESRLSLANWLTANGLAEAEEPRFETLDRQLAQLAAFAESGAVVPFSQRLEVARAETDRSRQGLLLDALGLDLAAAIRAQRELADFQRELDTLRAEASSLGQLEAHQAAITAIAMQLSQGQTTEARAALAAMAEELQANAKRKAAEAGRAAVLRGLKELGYEVREGMATAWAKEGKLVLRNPKHSGYGIEFGGRGESGRVQARAVAFGSRLQAPEADKEAEARFCGNLRQLQDLLTQSGSSLNIERAIPVGTQAVKRILDEREEDVEVEAPRYFSQG